MIDLLTLRQLLQSLGRLVDLLGDVGCCRIELDVLLNRVVLVLLQRERDVVSCQECLQSCLHVSYIYLQGCCALSLREVLAELAELGRPVLRHLSFELAGHVSRGGTD